MMLSMIGQPSEIDHFHFVLAEKLGKSVAEILTLDEVEIVHWRAYYVARHATQNQDRKV